MHAEILRLDLRLRHRTLLGYVTGMGLYALAIVVLYPSFKDSTSLDQLTKSGSTAAALFGLTGSLTSPAGWLDANLYENFLPLIMLLVTVGYGASCIAGQDEDGTLALAATLPISRRTMVLQKVAALIIQALLLAGATMLAVLAGRNFDLPVNVADLAGMSLGTALLGVDFGLLALALGTWTGSRGTALGLTTSLAAVSYVVSSLAPVVAWIRPSRFASLFYWSIGNGQLTGGLSAGSAAVLVLTATGFLAVSLAAFKRLDLH
jgi:ABC-2 type transport system permease protein